MSSLIERIMAGHNAESVLQSILGRLHAQGPTDYGDLEVLSYIKLYQPDLFSEYEVTILNLMGLYFKDGLSDDNDIRGVVSSILGRSIAEKYNHKYTPVQANLMDNIRDKRLFSFSSATSTGKSYVFRDLILRQEGDMMIVVPSRALINEYFIRTLAIVDGEKVSVLMFPDVVNTDLAERNVFILTPERVKDIFRLKNRLNLRTVLFDEAQMADDDSRRGIYFDSIVRRVYENFQDAKILFAQPYINNPEAQFHRNNLVDKTGAHSVSYPYRNVGQIFTCIDKVGTHHHFAIDKEKLGNRKVRLGYDLIAECLNDGGSILVYVSKTSIYTGQALEEMTEYIQSLELIENETALGIIGKIETLLGGTANTGSPEHSDLLSLLYQGIVIHHGSLPLQARFLVEEFINKGFCRICFATSTLYQGINMPFDIVYIKRLDKRKPLLVKNLIGRAGRSTTLPTFDFGQVLVNIGNMTSIRSILTSNDIMSEESQIDVIDVTDDEELKEFKEAIRNKELNDTYNLTEQQVARLGSPNTIASISAALDILLPEGKPMPEVCRNLTVDNQAIIIDSFKNIFKQHVKNRELSSGENAVIENAVHIFMGQVQGKNLRTIIGGRFGYIAQTQKRKDLEPLRETDPIAYSQYIEKLFPKFTMPANDIPNRNLPTFGLFPLGTKIYQVGYDRVMYDTYDYIDKIWGFCLSDIFYAAFDLFYQANSDKRAQLMCNYIRYATVDETEIWLLRYGFSFEEIEWIKPIIHGINEQKIEFGDISNLNGDQLKIISRYLPTPAEYK